VGLYRFDFHDVGDDGGHVGYLSGLHYYPVSVVEFRTSTLGIHTRSCRRTSTMSQLTLDLPESLRAELERQAEREGVSLQHYIVYLLTRLVTAADVVAQKVTFEEKATRHPQEQAEAALRSLLDSRQSS
jgi:hypothetical protein